MTRSLEDFVVAVQMQLARIIISEISDNQVIFLQEVEGSRQFPILIGMFEAASIDRRIKSDFKPARPLTHDLIVSVASTLGATIESVLISDMQDHTYYARLQLRRGEELIEIDSRPSDALAVAVTFNPPLPIYVADHVLEAAAS